MMPIAKTMKMRKMFYLDISTSSRVKIVCLLNNIVVIAKKTLVLAQNGACITTPVFVFTQVAFAQNINFEI